MVEGYKLCLKYISKPSENLKKPENRSAIALHSKELGYIIDFSGTRILHNGFSSYKERLTAETLHVWTNPHSVNWRN